MVEGVEKLVQYRLCPRCWHYMTQEECEQANFRSCPWCEKASLADFVPLDKRGERVLTVKGGQNPNISDFLPKMDRHPWGGDDGEAG